MTWLRNVAEQLLSYLLDCELGKEEDAFQLVRSIISAVFGLDFSNITWEVVLTDHMHIKAHIVRNIAIIQLLPIK